MCGQGWVAIYCIAIILQYAIKIIAIWVIEMYHIAIQSTPIWTYCNYIDSRIVQI